MIKGYSCHLLHLIVQEWQKTGNLVTFTEEILDEILHFLCSAVCDASIGV